MKHAAGYYKLLVPPFFFFVFLSVLFSFVYMVATHKKCWVHLKHGKMETSYYKLLCSLMFFSLYVQGTEFLTFHLHIVFLPSPGNNSSSTSNAFRLAFQMFGSPPSIQVNILHAQA